jgi:pyruvate ferredoxin oxidoreductase gamma subunit
VDLCGWEVLARALALELRAVGVEEDRLPQNLAAARRSFDAAPVVGFCARAAVEPAVRAVPAFEVPRLPARISAPSITAGATSVLRRTGSWRVFRPVIDLDRCTRCSICFALCPEGAIALDTSGTPFVDYDHCKGCLVCVEECPPEAITPIREAAA